MKFFTTKDTKDHEGSGKNFYFVSFVVSVFDVLQTAASTAVSMLRMM